MPGTPGTYGYCIPSDLNGILNGFTENYYGSGATATTSIESDINAAFRHMNEHFEGYAMVRKVPMPLEGSVYPQTLIDANAAWSIHRKLKAVHADEFVEGEPEWIRAFWNTGMRKIEDIRKGKVVFESFTALGEIGIGMPTAGTSGSSIGTFHNNWEGFGSPFYGDRRMSWQIKIDGAGPAGSATFKYSYDAGVSWADTGIIAGTEWEPLSYGIYVRFEGAGTAFHVDDYWDFDAVPPWIASYGDPNVIKAKTFLRA